MKFNILPITMVCIGLLTASMLQAGEKNVPKGDKAACMQGPLAEFGRYIGNWDIEDSSLSQDGKEWTKGAKDTT